MSEMTWEEVKDLLDRDALIIVPIGSTEEHGLHLPLATDSIIVEEISRRVAKELSEENIPIIVGPTIIFGYESREVKRFPGTIALRIETLINLVFDYISSLIAHGFKRIVVVNSHGQNYGALRVAIRKIYEEYGIPVALIPLCISLAKEVVEKYRGSQRGGIMHAGELETSLMLVLRRKLVKMDKAVKEVTKPPSDILGGDAFLPSKVFLTTWSYWHSERGVLGDPTMAKRDLGERALKEIVDEIKDIVKELYFKVFPAIEGHNKI